MDGNPTKTPDLEIADLARQIFEHMARDGDDGVGISRETYGPGESRALDYLENLARELGFETGRDGLGDLVVDLKGSDPSLAPVVSGSHLDSVPQGGNYDGLAGFVAALLALHATRQAGITPRRGLRALGLRGEESAWYGKCYIASLAMFGNLPAEDLDAVHRSGKGTLRDAMAKAGVDVGAITDGRPFADPDDFAAFIELHIEQGPVMIAREVPVAMVTGIRGNIRHRHVVCRGRAGHSGAVPRWLRHDAVLATAELLNGMDEHWRILLERGRDLVMTVGILHTNPDEEAMSRIPGECSFSFEMRSQHQETLDAFEALLRDEARTIGQKRGVAFEFDRPIPSPPAGMDEGILAVMRRAFEAEGLKQEEIPSGAGHDAAVFANAGVPTGMLFIRNAHGSHNPDEAMDLDDFLKGVAVLTRTMQELAR